MKGKPQTRHANGRDLRAAANKPGGEGEVGALVIGTYGFTRIVSEITVCPRPASPGSTITVEIKNYNTHPHHKSAGKLSSTQTTKHQNQSGDHYPKYKRNQNNQPPKGLVTR
jgi:hypothetical protein